MTLGYWKTALLGAALAASFSGAASAGPIRNFLVSEGTQPSNVGAIKLTQVDANSVKIAVDLLDGYGFINSGGPHTPFAFTLNGGEAGLSLLSWTTPTNGDAPKGDFSLSTAGTFGASPFGDFDTALEYSGKNGSGDGYFGDLVFTLTRSGGLDTEDFITNSMGYFFAADLSNGSNTGSQAWAIDPPETSVPEPFTLSLFGAGMMGAVGFGRRKMKNKN